MLQVMSSTSVSILPCGVRMGSSCKFQPAVLCFSHVMVMMSKHKAKHQILRNQVKLRSLGTTGHRVRISDRFRNMVVCSSVGSGPPVPSNPTPDPGSWKLWLLGILISIILPFWRGKWGPLLKLKDEVESIIDKAEAVTDIVEKVADQVEEIVDDIGNHLPEGKLKDALEIVEDMAEDTADGARLAGDFIDKVEDMVDEVESLVEHNSSDEQAEKKTKKEEEEKEAKGQD